MTYTEFTTIREKVYMTKDQLLHRRDEIRNELARHDGDIQMELDRDPEEQAIQMEQHDVTVGIVENLRRELAEIEDKLLDYEN